MHEFDYDAVDGVRRRVRTPDGVETIYTYYDSSSTEAKGCPPPPTLADRRRYPQTIAITYPQVAAAGGSTFDAPPEVHTLTYHAIALASDGANAPAAYAVVPLRVVSSVAGVDVRQVDIAWYESNADTGRIKTVTEKLAVVDSNGNTGALQLAAQLQVSYASSQDAFTEALVLTGYDGDGKAQTASASRTFCPRTGALTAITDQLGVTQTRAHDWLGRIVALTTASGSPDYQHILKCDYTLADDGSGTGVSLLQGKIYDDTQTTPAAMQRAANVHFDGAHRAIAVDIDADNTSNFVQSATALHDALARPTVYNTFDQTISTTISTTRTNGYDAWTLNNVQGASTGATGRSDFDPVSRVNATTWTATQPSNMAAGLITTYDDLNTPATIGRRDSSGKTIATTTMVHDGRKRQRSHTSEAGNTTTTGHDAWNRPITATLPDKTVIDVAHAFNTTHPLPQAICVTPAGGQKATVATRSHDGLLRPVTETWDARTTSWTYNTGATKPATRTLQDKLKQHAATTTCTYVSELKEALASRSAGSITQTFAYDRRGSLTSATQVDAADPRNNATVVRSHDRWGRISTENVKLGGQDLGTATWTYTRLGKPIKWTHASADANIGVDASYDFTWYANGLLSAAKRKVGKAPDYTIAYSYFDNTSETAPVASANGVHAGMLQGWTVTTNGAVLAKTRLTYDDFNREASRTISFYPIGNPTTPCSTTVINRTYGPDNRLAKSVVIQDGVMIQTMDLGGDAYDARQRLAHVTYTGAYRPQLDNGAPIDSIAYAQDALNNITSVTRAAGATQDADAFAYNSDTSFQISNITRTLAGVPTTLAVSHDPATGAITQLGDDAYTYDALGRLTHASRQGADAKAATYRYDALDRLICETPDSGQARFFVYAGDTLAAFIDASVDGAPSGQVTQLMQAAGGTVLEIQGNVGANLLTTDVSGTVIAFADRDDIAEGLPDGPSFIAWDPYGAAPETRPENPPATGYNGHYADQTFQIQHLGNGHRPYAPQIARFLAPDTESPFGNGGLNPYAYCENDPVNFTDPTGKMKWWKIFVCIAYAEVALAGIGLAIAAIPVFGVTALVVVGGAVAAWGVTGIIDEATSPQAVSYTTANSGGGSNSADHTYKTSHSIHKWSLLIGAAVAGFSGGSAKKTASPSPESVAAKSPGRLGSAPDIIGGSGGTRALPQPEKASNEALLNPKSHPENAAPGWGPPDVATHASSPAHPYDDVFPAGNPANKRLWVMPANADASSGFGHIRPHFGKPAGTRR